MKSKKWFCIVLSLLLIATLAACSKKSESPTATSNQDRAGQSESAPSEDLKFGGAPAQVSRKIIMNANATIKVDSIGEAVEQAERLTLQSGGYVKESFLNENRGNVTLMIPSGDLDSFLLGLESIGKITTKSKSSEDVTDAYFDTEVRIKNLETEIAIMRGLLEKQGWKVSEILEIEREIRRLTDELELLKGQLSNLDRKVQFSQLDIEFIAEKSDLAVDDNESLINKIKTAFEYGLSALINILVVTLSVIVFLLPLLPIAIVLYIAWRFILKPIINKKSPK